MAIPTTTEAGEPYEWLIEDGPTHFRRWGTDVGHPFPATTTAGEWILGAADGCWLQLQDEESRVSRQHARLVNDNGRWLVVDLGSKNGVYQDGARRSSVPLAPGVGLGVGDITLITGSPRLSALREVVARLIGWSEERREDVDLALRSLRIAATRRESLQLCGSGNLVSIAQLLHRHTLGDARPFIVCDPRRRRADPARARRRTTTAAWRRWPLPPAERCASGRIDDPTTSIG